MDLEGSGHVLSEVLSQQLSVGTEEKHEFRTDHVRSRSRDRDLMGR
jgi:hypothetical protein